MQVPCKSEGPPLRLMHAAKRLIAASVAAFTYTASMSTAACPPCAAGSSALCAYLAQAAPTLEGRRGLPTNSNLLSGVMIASIPAQSAFPDGVFQRQDESDDAVFYSQPRFVYHIDEGARTALTAHYSGVLSSETGAHLDICSSWVSFLPQGYAPARCAGLGLVAAEMEANEQLTESVVHDLNAAPRFPFEDRSFDALTCVVSIDYLKRPFEVLRETRRVLRPGGVAVLSFSNRAFWTKATRIWVEATEWQRVLIVAALYQSAGFEGVEAFEVSGEGGDPMYVVQGTSPMRVASEL